MSEISCILALFLDHLVCIDFQQRLEIVDAPEFGGKSVIAKELIGQGDIITVYDGVTLTPSEMHILKRGRSKKIRDNEFVFEIKLPGGQSWGLDASSPGTFKFMGRWLNHSRDSQTINCHPKLEWKDGKPIIYFQSDRVIYPGEHIRYEYGDKSKEASQNDPWLNPPSRDD